MKKKDKNNTLLVVGLLLLIGIIGVGYAALSQVLNINGTANIGRSSWNVHFDNVHVNEESVEAEEDPYTISNTTTLNYETTLNVPGDFYEFNVDVVNTGSITAQLNSTTLSGAESYPFIVYTVKMLDGGSKVDVPTDLTLEQNDSVTLVVRVEYSRELADPSLLNTSIGPLSLTYQMNFVQA